MIYQTKKIFEMEKSFYQKHQKKPYSPSDWEFDYTKILLPSTSLTKTIVGSRKNFSKYLYIYNQEYLKSLIVERLEIKDERLKKITITPSSTAALFLITKAISKLKKQRCLIVTPFYFSIDKSLKDGSCEIFYYHLTPENNYIISKSRIQKIIRNQYIDLLIITDPIYSLGISINNQTIKIIANICNEENVTLFLDYTLGGMEWAKETYQLLDLEKLRSVSRAKEFIFNCSPSKLMFLNGIKFALTFCSKDLVEKIEEISDYTIASFCSTQVSLINALFMTEWDEISECISHNVRLFSNTFKLVKSCAIGTGFKIARPDSGFYTMAQLDGLKFEKSDIIQVLKKILFEKQVFVLPSSEFSFYFDRQFSFRINLSKDPSNLIPNLIEVFNFDFDTL